MARKFLVFVLVVVFFALFEQCYGSAIRDERELLRRKRLLGLLGGGGQGGGGGGALDLGSLLGGLTNTLGGLTQGLGLGNLLGRRRRFLNDLDLDAADYADALEY